MLSVHTYEKFQSVDLRHYRQPAQRKGKERSKRKLDFADCRRNLERLSVWILIPSFLGVGGDLLGSTFSEIHFLFRPLGFPRNGLSCLDFHSQPQVFYVKMLPHQ